MRNCIGADPNTGSIAIGDFLRPGKRFNFIFATPRVRMKTCAVLTAQARNELADDQARGALLFTCNGRGTRLFDQPNHDAGLLASQFSDLPTAGLFAQGEIGPIGGRNFLHGFTACVALFGPATQQR